MKTKASTRRKITVHKPRPVSQRGANPGGPGTIIREVSKVWVEHWNAGKLDKIIATYAPDAFYVSPGHEVLHGRGTIREYLRERVRQGVSDLALDISYVKLQVTCAWAIGTYRMHVTQGADRRKEERGNRLTIWQRIAGKWLIVADAWHSEPVQLKGKSQVTLTTPEPQSLELRLANLQSKVDQLLQTHFIEAEFRPDLSTSALPSGLDVQKGRAKRETKEAKEKDLSIKESEKLKESTIIAQASRLSRLRVFAHSVHPVMARLSTTNGFDYPTTKRGQTKNFNVYYDPTLGAGGAFIADAVLASCEDDYKKVQAYFGGITPSGLPFNIIIAAGIGGAYHRGCGAVDLYCDADTSAIPDVDHHTRMLVVGEEVEVFCATQNAGWDCGASNGEGLSRVLATDAYPTELNGFATAASWLDSAARPDWVSNTAPTDQDPTANGCSVLFLNYLHSQLGFGWGAIVQAGAPTLAETHQNLTGENDGFDQFSSLLQMYYPLGTRSGLTTDNPFPLAGASVAVALQQRGAARKNGAQADGRKDRSRAKKRKLRQ